MKSINKISTAVVFLLMFASLLISIGFEPKLSFVVSLVLSAIFYVAADRLPANAFGVSVCGNWGGNVLNNCDKPLQAGTENRLLVINREDIESVVYNVANDMIVEDIVLKTGKLAYLIDGKKNSIVPDYKLAPQTYVSLWDHNVNAKGFDISPETKKVLQDSIDGKFVCIVENVYKGTAGNSAFEIYGLDSGMEIPIMERMPNDAATQGAFNFNFTTDEVSKEPKMPRTWFDTDYATTLALVDALLA